MRAKLFALVLCTTAISVVAGCPPAGSGSITVASGKGITIVCGGGGFSVGNGTVSITGLTASTSDGRKIKKVRIVLFIDRNGDGIPDPTEILDHGDLDSPLGEPQWTCGTLHGSWGSSDPLPKILIEVELLDGTKWKQTKGCDKDPMLATPEAVELFEGGGPSLPR